MQKYEKIIKLLFEKITDINIKILQGKNAILYKSTLYL